MVTTIAWISFILFVTSYLLTKAMKHQKFLELIAQTGMVTEVPDKYKLIRQYHWSDDLCHEMDEIIRKKLNEEEEAELKLKAQEKEKKLLTSVPHFVSCQCNTCCEKRILGGIKDTEDWEKFHRSSLITGMVYREKHIPVKQRVSNSKVKLKVKEIKHPRPIDNDIDAALNSRVCRDSFGQLHAIYYDESGVENWGH